MSAILAFLNGLFHASAWTSYFPTEFERHLWRAACVIHACAPIILVAAVNFETYEKNLMQTFYFFGYATKPTLRSFFHYAQSVTAMDTKLILGRKTSKSKFKKRLINYPHFALMVINLLIYYGCIFILNVLAFICLRRLPLDAFKVVPWSEFWPHF